MSTLKDEIVEPAVALAVLPDDASMRDWEEYLVVRTRIEGVDLTGGGGLLTGVVRQVLQSSLEVELWDHLGCESYEASGRGAGDSPTSRQRWRTSTSSAPGARGTVRT